jgi:hypothetical protein
MNKIPAGYRFSFVSNDLHDENEKTIIKDGLNESEAHLFSDLANFLQGGTGLELDDLAQWRKNKIHETLMNIFESYPTMFSPEKIAEFKSDIGAIMDFISENMLGYSHEDNVNMRFLITYKIEDIPQDILINDVTEKFNKKPKV